MRILLDHNVPAPLRYILQGHQVEITYERGWARLSNGDLAATAERSGFDLLITSDLALIILTTNDWPRLRQASALIVESVDQLPRHGFVKLSIP